MIFQEGAANSPARLMMILGVSVYLVAQYWLIPQYRKVMKQKNPPPHYVWFYWGLVVLIIGDTLHVFYLIIAYIANDIYLGGFGTFALLFTSIAMTVYYIPLLYFQSKEYPKKDSSLIKVLIVLFIIRVIVGVLPQNYFGIPNPPEFPENIRIITNILFSIFGVGVAILFLKNAKRTGSTPNKNLYKMGIWILLSYVFFISYFVLYPFHGAFGAFMLPKSLAYAMQAFYMRKALENIQSAPGQ